jgi:hypothetical protein
MAADQTSAEPRSFQTGTESGSSCDNALAELPICCLSLNATGWTVVIERGKLVKYWFSIRTPRYSTCGVHARSCSPTTGAGISQPRPHRLTQEAWARNQTFPGSFPRARTTHNPQEESGDAQGPCTCGRARPGPGGGRAWSVDRASGVAP